MDKKVYMAPEMETIDIEVRSMLCMSEGNSPDPNDPQDP